MTFTGNFFLDAIDRKILDILQANADTALTVVA